MSHAKKLTPSRIAAISARWLRRPLGASKTTASCRSKSKSTRSEIMGMGPVVAVPKALKLAGLTLDQIDLIELNEAFACQAIAVMRELGIDDERTNTNGGAVALGHPLGASGAKLTVQLLGEMRRRKSRYGMVTMCVGGGQGAATIFENLQ